MANYEIIGTQETSVGTASIVKFTADNGYSETQAYVGDETVLQTALDHFNATAPEQKTAAIIEEITQA